MPAPLVEDPNAVARELFQGLPQRYDLLAEALSLGQNARWRRAMVDRVVAARPRSVLDVATGTGSVALQVARRTGAHVTGVDLSEPMLRRARSRVARRGRQHQVRLLLARAEQLPFPDASFDAVTFTYLLRYVVDPGATLRELARVLRPGGTMASLEFLVPPRAPARGLWWGYTRLVLPLAGRAFGPDWGRVGRFLGPSISGHYRRFPVAWTVEAWRAAGLVDVHARRMSCGGGLVMWGRRAGA